MANSKKCEVTPILFGSRRTGQARADSDYDVLLVADDLTRLIVPRPLPHDEPGFYDPDVAIAGHHAQKHLWSQELWQRLGGEASVAQFQELTSAFLRPQFGDVDPSCVDLFLYFPPDVSARVWAVRLEWSHDNAMLDYVCAEARKYWEQDSELKAIYQRPASSAQRATALMNAMQHRGISIADDYLRSASLPEMRRDVPRYEECRDQTGKP